MNKEYTTNDIAEYFINSSMPCVADGVYYARINENGDLVYTSKNAIETFEVEVDVSEWKNDENPSRFYEEYETKDNHEFMNMCNEMVDKINTYLNEEKAVKRCGKCKHRAYSSWCGVDYCIDYEMATTEEEEIEAAKDCFKYEEGTPSCYEDDEYCPSATAGDYSPSSPWNAPGMSIKDFI